MKTILNELKRIVREKGNINNAIDLYIIANRPRIAIEVYDFTGFDKHMCEQFQDYSRETIAALREWLDAHCEEKVNYCYTKIWKFREGEVRMNFSSWDI